MALTLFLSCGRSHTNAPVRCHSSSFLQTAMMKLKNFSALPKPLKKEAENASRIFKSFVDNGNNGLDGIIPRQVLEEARGFAIFTIIKAGFLFSARAGSGIVIARLPDGTWSCPSAIGTAGLGIGGQAGAEMTDFLVVLNSRSAVRSFMSAGSLTLGGNMSIALGPLGRNGEASGSVNTKGKVAAMYSYSKTRGLFGGLSIEGSVIVERQDANAQAYDADVTVQQLLSGAIEHPEWAMPLIKTLEACVGMPGGHKWVNDAADGNFNSVRDGDYAFGSASAVSSPGSENAPSSHRKKKGSTPSFPPASWGRKKSGGSYFDQLDDDTSSNVPPVGQLIDDGSAARSFSTRFDSDYSAEVNNRPTHRPTLSLRSNTAHTSTFDPDSPFNDLPPFPSTAKRGLAHNRSISSGSYLVTNRRSSFNPFAAKKDDPVSTSLLNADHSDDEILSDTPSINKSSSTGSKPILTPKAGLSAPLSPLHGIGRAIALFDFDAVESGDLSFRKGQVITITEKTEKTDDWWTGKLEGREGIFPANFVDVV